ncbi:hypothetical protein BJ508DRAFT_178198 [Ascobolus immersus RN42]|uniref:Uncharacterized protein n=1 Tax=Ascobolus immersus RN42 TaxID=1160509 RepID=A0A3N4IHD3_ASCIM|nr:hypothetical protein BJ508DRAFT_178198 [Ascobolus immersus RN42]
MWFIDIFLYIFGFLPSEKSAALPALPAPPTPATTASKEDGITPSESASRVADDRDSDYTSDEEEEEYMRREDAYYDDDSLSAASTARYNSKSAPSPFMLSKFARPNVHAKPQPMPQERRVSIGGVEEDERHKEVLSMWLSNAHMGR